MELARTSCACHDGDCQEGVARETTLSESLTQSVHRLLSASRVGITDNLYHAQQNTFHRCHQEPERVAEGDLTCGISPIGLAVSGNEVEIEYGSAVFPSGLRTGYDEAVRFKVEFLRPRKLNRCYAAIVGIGLHTQPDYVATAGFHNKVSTVPESP